jgi:NADPH2:quinone reductase
VRLTAYGGESSDLPCEVLQRWVDGIASGNVGLGPVQHYTLDQIRQAHDDMEHNRTIGKQVVVL